MSSFGLYLASVSTPIVQRVLTGLGFGVVSYVGLDAVFQSVQTNVVNQWGLIPAAAAGMLGLSGVPTAMGIILGALACRFSMLQLKNLGMIQ